MVAWYRVSRKMVRRQVNTTRVVVTLDNGRKLQAWSSQPERYKELMDLNQYDYVKIEFDADYKKDIGEGVTIQHGWFVIDSCSRSEYKG